MHPSPAASWDALGAGIGAIAGSGDVREDRRLSCTRMLFMVIERFRPGRVDDVYRRFREHGRLAPAGLEYVASWVDLEFSRCFQVMATADRALLDEWIAPWADLVEFEVIPVRESADAAALRAAAFKA